MQASGQRDAGKCSAVQLETVPDRGCISLLVLLDLSAAQHYRSQHSFE